MKTLTAAISDETSKTLQEVQNCITEVVIETQDQVSLFLFAAP